MSMFTDGQDPHTVFTYSDITEDIRSVTINEDDFLDTYDKEKIDADKTRVRGIKINRDIIDTESIDGFLTKSRVQEYATKEEIGESDWFGEDGRTDALFPNENGQQIVTFLSSEFDDYINHVDIICVMNNSESNFEPIPFALDVTYNTDEDGLNKKMTWGHPSESIKEPGFAEVEYFEDTMSFDPQIKKGKIAILPRFVVGFSPELSEKITYLRMQSNGAFSTKRELVSDQAKWCVLKELDNQAGQMLEYLEVHRSDNALLETAFSQVKSLKGYFEGAIEFARAQDQPDHALEQYVETDEVARAILSKKLYSD